MTLVGVLGRYGPGGRQAQGKERTKRKSILGIKLRLESAHKWEEGLSKPNQNRISPQLVCSGIGGYLHHAVHYQTHSALDARGTGVVLLHDLLE